MKNKIFVAEIKTVSPFGFKSNYSLEHLMDLAITHGDAVSAHVDSLWGGNHFQMHEVWNEMVRRRRNYGEKKKPLIAKGLHLTDESIEKSIFEYGASYCVVVGRIPAKKYLKYCWLEPVTNEQGNEMAAVGPAAIVVNRRHLESGQDLGYGPFIPESKYIKRGTKIIQASMIKRAKDVQPWADGYIVGEALPAFILERAVLGLREDK